MRPPPLPLRGTGDSVGGVVSVGVGVAVGGVGVCVGAGVAVGGMGVSVGAGVAVGARLTVGTVGPHAQTSKTRVTKTSDLIAGLHTSYLPILAIREYAIDIPDYHSTRRPAACSPAK